MRKTLGSTRTARVALALAATALLTFALPSPGAASGGEKRPAPPMLMGDKEGEERERNEQWFYEQRAYPFGTIPPDARRTAWEQWKRIEARTPATTQAPRPEAVAKAAAPSRAWRSIGPAPTTSFIDSISPVSGRIRALAVSPADARIVLVGGAGGGIWRSADAGATFVPVSDNHVDLAVGAIAFAPSNPQIVYAAMGQEYLGSGVLTSTDAGQTWRRVSDTSLPTPGLASDIAVDPRDPNRVYLAQYAGLGSDGTLYSSGFYVSSDGGRSWTRTLTGLAKDVAIDPSDPQTLYLSMKRVDGGGGQPAGIYRSTDAGRTWAHLFVGPFAPNQLPAFSLAVTPADPNRVYAFGSGVVGSTREYRIAVSTNRGQDFSLATPSGLVASEATFLVASPSDPQTLYVGYPGGDNFKSTDGGAQWRCLSNGYCDGRFAQGDKIHVDQHAFAFDPNDANHVYQANDGGLYSSSDGGTTWRSLNQSLSLVTYRTLAISPANPFLSIGGTQDNGSQRRPTGASSWDEIITGDGGGVVFNPADPSVLFTTYIYGTVYRWTEDGGRFDRRVATEETFDESESRPRIAFYPPFVGDGVTSRLYFGTWRLFVSDDLGERWTAPAGSLDLTRGAGTNDVLSAIGVGPADPDVVYTGSAQGRAQVSADGGRTWRDVTAGLPNRFITSITVDRANASIAYLTVSGFRAGHVFKTTNMGATWTDVSGTLPDIPANAVLQDPLDPATLYLGTDIGVFRSTSSGQAWERFNDGMPPALALGFASHPSGVVQVATYGRGAYELGTSASAADFALGFAPATLTIGRGGKATIRVYVQRANGFAEQVAVSAPDASALKLKVKPSSVPATDLSVRVAIKAKKAVQPGTYDVTFTGRSASGVVRTASLSITIQ